MTKPLSDWTVILKTLADETRLRIMNILLDHEASVNELAKTLGMENYNISKHLKLLESCALVEKRKDGANRIFKIAEGMRSRFSDDILDLGCCKFNFKDLRK